LYSIFEYNFVRPFTYSHVISSQNYGHKNHSLAHPLESNFKEFLIIIGFQRNNFDFTIQFHNQKFGIDSANINFGGNMFNSYEDRSGDQNQYVGQGNLIKQNILIVQLSYLLAPITNTKLYFCFNMKKSKDLNSISLNNTFFNFGISSRLWQSNYDF
jgi:hypothetical protein